MYSWQKNLKQWSTNSISKRRKLLSSNVWSIIYVSHKRFKTQVSNRHLEVVTMPTCRRQTSKAVRFDENTAIPSSIHLPMSAKKEPNRKTSSFSLKAVIHTPCLCPQPCHLSRRLMESLMKGTRTWSWTAAWSTKPLKVWIRKKTEKCIDIASTVHQGHQGQL